MTKFWSRTIFFERTVHRFDRSKIEYRKFIWDRLPTGLRQLKQMAWKILIIIESIGEFGGIIWFDASVALKGEYKPMINDVLMARDSCFSFTNGPSQIDAYTIVTPPIVNYIPVDKEPMRNMFGGQSHSFIAYNTEECQKSLWKPLLMCTLTRKCLDPSGAASRNCGHNCRHLFDTSILTALLNNLYRYDPDCYRLRSTEQTIIDPRASKLQKVVKMVFAQKVMENLSSKEVFRPKKIKIKRHFQKKSGNIINLIDFLTLRPFSLNFHTFRYA